MLNFNKAKHSSLEESIDSTDFVQLLQHIYHITHQLVSC